MFTKLWYNEERKAVLLWNGSFFLVAFVIFIPIVLYLIFAPIFREQKISGEIRNTDTFAQNYLFKIKCSKQDFLHQIEIPNVNDKLDYVFDNNTMTITFAKYGTHIPYTVIIKEVEDVCYLRLKKNVVFSNKSNIPSYINEFMIKKFNAELLPYEEYKNTVT